MGVDVVERDETLSHAVQSLTDSTALAATRQDAAELIAKLFLENAVTNNLKIKPRTVLDRLFEILKNENENDNVRQHVLTALGNLTGDSDPSQDWLVSDYDAINVFIGVLHQSSNLPDLQAQAFYALQKLASRNKSNIEKLFADHHAHELALASIAMHRTHIPLQTQACAIIRRLSFVETTWPVLLATSCQTMLNAMKTFHHHTELVEYCCAFVSNLAIEPNNQIILVAEPYLAHEAILNAMREHQQQAAIQQTVSKALTSIVKNANNNQMLVREPYLAHEAVLNAMRLHPNDASVQEQTCGTLWDMVVSTENQQLITQPPHLAHELILNTMRKFPNDTGVQENACGALRNLACVQSNRPLFLSNVAHQALLTAMHDHPNNKMIQTQACAAIASLAVKEDYASLLYQIEAPVAILAALRLHKHEEDVQNYGVWALANLAHHPTNQTVLRQLEVLPLCERAAQLFPHNEAIALSITKLSNRLL